MVTETSPNYAPKYSESTTAIIDSNTQLQQMNAEELELTFFASISAHPDLRDHRDEIEQAHADMTKVHEGQIRIQTGQPYKTHPERVALLTIDLLEYLDMPVTPTAVIAALKHDMIEDGKKHGITVDEISRQSGQEVGSIVYTLTRDEIGGKLISKKDALRKIDRASGEGEMLASVIKTADRIDNVRNQQGVARPKIADYLHILSDEFRDSPYGQWRKTRRQTTTLFPQFVTRDEPRLTSVLFAAIDKTTTEIKSRSRKAIK